MQSNENSVSVKKKIYLIDTSSMFFRAFYAVRPLNSTKGVPVNAVYGFVSMIIKLLKEKKPDYIVFCYDRKEPSFRKDLDLNYKANRTEMPDDLQVQMPYIKQVAGLFGIADLEAPGYEADDIIGTIATMASRENFETYIVSGDKDFCQLVSDNTFVYDTMKEVLVTPGLVQEKYGVSAEQFRDYLAITGDTSDNIPGVKGIGPKGAQSLIQEFNSLEGIYQNIDKVKSATVKEKLLNSKEQAFLSQKLVSIVLDIDLKRDMESFLRGPVKSDELRAFFQELNFKTFEKTFFAQESNSISTSAPAADSSLQPYLPSADSSSISSVSAPRSEQHAGTIVRAEWNRDVVQEKIKRFPSFLFLLGSQLCFIIEEGAQATLTTAQLSEAKLDFSGVGFRGFDLKRIWTELGLSPKEIESVKVELDLMLSCYLLASKDCSDYLKCFKTILKEEVEDTLAEDQVDVKIAELMKKLEQQVSSSIDEKKLNSILSQCDLPIVKILFKMERTGIKIDSARLKDYSEELGSEIQSLESKIHEIAGEKFNVGSPKQLGAILFEKLGLPAAKKTKTGYSTDNEVLEKLNHPIAQLLMDYRELTKLKSTYVDSLPEMADQSGRIHSNFQQAVTATGRFSSINPNLQNIPIRTERGQRVRTAFIPENGNVLLAIDYSQIELRVLADIADDAGLIDAFQKDLDIHAATAAEVFGIPVTSVTGDQRRIAKAVNFGIAYGQGAFGLAETLGISRTESKDIIERYFQKFKGIKDYIESTIERAHKDKFVETKFGRRRYIPELDSSNMMLKKFGERAAINAPIQGTASDLVKMAMIDVDRMTTLKMILQVHDELLFEGPVDLIEAELPKIRYAMENVARLKVPLKVNASVGKNWDEAH